MSAVTNIETPILTTPNRNGHKAQEIERRSEKLPLRMRLKEYVRRYSLRLRKAWAVVVKTEARYSISQPLALVIIGALCTVGAAGWWRSADKIQDQHDEIIRLQTRLETQKEKNTDQDSKIDQAANWGQSAKADVKYLQGKFDEWERHVSKRVKEE